MSCAKMAEPIDMQSGMLIWVDPGNMYYMGMQMAHGKGHFWGLWLTEKRLGSR